MTRAEVANKFRSDTQDYISRYLPRTTHTRVFEIEPCRESLATFVSLLENKEIASYEGVTICHDRYILLRHTLSRRNKEEELNPMPNLTLVTPFHNIRQWIKLYLEGKERFDATLINRSMIGDEEFEIYKKMLEERKIYLFEYYSDSSNIERRIL